MRNDPIVESVVKKLRERSKVGIKTYGTTLEENNTDDFLVHAQEEAMDLANYLEKLIFEQDLLKGRIESGLRLKTELALAYFQMGELEKAHELLVLAMQAEIGWVSGKYIVDAAMALAKIGFEKEALIKIRELELVKNEIGV